MFAFREMNFPRFTPIFPRRLLKSRQDLSPAATTAEKDFRGRRADRRMPLWLPASHRKVDIPLCCQSLARIWV